jgi:hypothetical protein
MWHEYELYCDQRHCFHIVHVFHTLSGRAFKIALGLANYHPALVKTAVLLFYVIVFVLYSCQLLSNGLIASRSIYESRHRRDRQSRSALLLLN